jgi:hypothetical protein
MAILIKVLVMLVMIHVVYALWDFADAAWASHDVKERSK